MRVGVGWHLFTPLFWWGRGMELDGQRGSLLVREDEMMDAVEVFVHEWLRWTI
jgi:hypothetical protein